MKLFTSNKGAVSVFLVMILVPTLIITSLFVDVSRVYLGKSVTESAADLALNTKLTQYDKELSDMYGLFANSQTTEDVTDNLDKYFDKCLVSSGVETTDLSKYGNMLSGLVDEDAGNEYSDLLNIHQVDSSATITPVKNGNLGNAPVLKNQIVSFMKYRAPVNIFQTFLDSLKKANTGLDIVDEETQVTNTMNDYFESENTVLGYLNKAYSNISDYQKNGGMNETYINDVVSELNKMPAEYEHLHKRLFMDLYNTQNIKGYHDFNTDIYSINEYYYKDNSCTEMTVETAKSKAVEYMLQARSYTSTYITDYQKVSNARACCVNNSSGNLDIPSNYYDAQWLEEVYSITCTTMGSYANDANNFNKSMAMLYKAYTLLSENDYKYLKDRKPSTIWNFENLKDDSLTANSSLYEYYMFLINKYIEIAQYFPDGNTNIVSIGELGKVKDFKNFAELASNTFDKLDNYDSNLGYSKINYSDVESALQQNSTFLNDNYTKIENAKKLVTKAKGDIKNAKAELEKSGGTIERYGKWENALNADAYQEMTEEELEKVAPVHTSSATTKEEENDEIRGFHTNVTSASLQEMYNRIESIESLLQKMLDTINSLKYNGTTVKSIKTYEKFKNSSGINEDKIVPELKTLNDNAEKSFLFTPKGGVSITVTDENNPDFDHAPIPKLYTYMVRVLIVKNEPNAEDYNSKYEDQKTNNNDDAKLDSVEEDSDISTNEIGSGKAPDSSITKKISEVAGKITGFISGVGEYINNPTKARDDLYVLDYAMNMFSYDTYNKEGLYNLAYAKPEDGLNDPTKVRNLRGKYKDEWATVDTTFTDNKTLTNYLQNKDNNYSFGNEIEYVLYGGTNSSNKSAVAAKIFLIRYACNLGPEFSANWKLDTLNNFANAIKAAFPYIPVALVKTVVILALTAAESADDVTCLKEGMKVELVKDKKDLVYTFSAESIANIGTREPKKVADINGMQYSDYLSIFLFLNLVNTNTQTDTINRIGDVIGRNVGNAKGYNNESEVFEMSKANTYFNLKTTVQISPLLLSLPVIQNDSANKVNSISWWKWDYSLTRGYN